MSRRKDSEGRIGEIQEIKPVGDELLEEFANIDYPLFGLSIPIHVFTLFFVGILTHACMAYYTLYLWPMGYLPRGAILLGLCHGYMSGLGITVGCHRYWTHRTFKANKPLQVLLMLMQTSSLQLPIFKWCRDHRVHHKFTDTNADPHNATRGFWFSHITWLFQPRHPELLEKFRTIDLSDLATDQIVRFQSKYYGELALLTGFFIPMNAYHYLFPEMTWVQIFVANMAQYGLSLHFTFLVNSVAHKWGDKPYDKYISARDSKWVSILAVGEGWHNYHHTFPWDYKAAELGFRYNLSTAFIHFFAVIGWAWDLKTVSHKLLVDRINRTGDENHPFYSKNDARDVVKEGKPARAYWGWGDKELRQEDLEITETVFPGKSRRG